MSCQVFEAQTDQLFTPVYVLRCEMLPLLSSLFNYIYIESYLTKYVFPPSVKAVHASILNAWVMKIQKYKKL